MPRSLVLGSLVLAFVAAACSSRRGAPASVAEPDAATVDAPVAAPAATSLETLLASLPPPAPGSVRLHGTVELVDGPRGAPRAPREGWFHLFINHGEGFDPTNATVRDGAWFLDVPAGFDDYTVGKMELDGVPARCERVVAEQPPRGALHLEARVLRPTVVHVVAPGTGREFTAGVELVASEDSVLPSVPNAALSVRGTSPLELPQFSSGGIVPEQWLGHERWWARAPGYAWKRIDVDLALGGERTIELEPAGVLIVDVAEGTSREGLSVRLSHGGETSQLSQWAPTQPEPWIFESLAPGDYRVLVERYAQRANELVAELDARVAAGEATELAIDLTPREPAAGEMPLFGTITLAPEWNGVEFTFQLARLTDSYEWVARPTVSALDPNVWRWDAGLRERGRYMAFLRPFLASLVFDYDPLNASNFALVIAPPADVCVKLVDPRTGEPVRDEHVSWYGMPPSEPSGIAPESAPFDRERDGYCFRAAAGEIVLCFADAEQTLRFEPARVKPGANTVEIAYAPYVRVRCFVVQDGKRVPWPDPVYVGAVERGQPRHQRATFHHELDVELGFDEPGTYELRLECWSGDEDEEYEPSTATVEAVRERTVEVEFPLKRIR
ncbi:MAG: hypothetical protein HZA52_17330 [Planctomycetes bacterium]|nr:hypothetical protein [Planctomycetota bacterium]